MDWSSISEFSAQRIAQSAKDSSLRKLILRTESLFIPRSVWCNITIVKFTIGRVKLRRKAPLFGLTAIYPELSTGCK